LTGRGLNWTGYYSIRFAQCCVPYDSVALASLIYVKFDGPQDGEKILRWRKMLVEEN